VLIGCDSGPQLGTEGAIIIQIINTSGLACLLFTLPPRSEHSGDPSDRCGSRWHRSDPRVLSLGSRGSSRGFSRTRAMAVSPVRKLTLAGDQGWWKPSPTSSAPPPHPVPPSLWERSGCGKQLSLLVQRKALTQLGLVCSGVPGLDAAGKSMHRLQWCTPAICEAGSQAWWEGEGTETHSEVRFLCPGCSFGFHLGCSSSVLNRQRVCGAAVLSPSPPLPPVCQYKRF